MKKIALILASVFTSAGAAIAGPYVNVENNASYTGSDYGGSVTDFHVGWEGGNETFDYYVQGGPAVVSADAEDNDTQLSGKVGANIAATEQLGFYGEVSVLTQEGDADNFWGTKIGAKYSF
jgi:outer membrane autotransporter protein